MLSTGAAVVGLAAPAQAATPTSVVQPQITFVSCTGQRTPPIEFTGQTSSVHCFGGTVGTITTLFFGQFMHSGGYYGHFIYSGGPAPVKFRPGEVITLGASSLIQSVTITPPF